jgi:uroporphyrinogen decarboxylase
MRPNIVEFINTLNRRPARFVPVAELGIHPLIKERFLGRPVRTLEDEVAFWAGAGYDYIKLQPAVDFDPGRIRGSDNVTYAPDGTVLRTWASEGSGIITDEESFEAYRFPASSDFDYTRFEQIRELLPEGLGVIGQYGDIFTMTWEMMGFEGFSLALYENPDLLGRLNTLLGELVVSMFEYFAQSDAVDVLWYSDDIAYADGLMISPAALRKYFFPWLRRIGELAKKAGKPLIYHTDGILYDVFDEIIDCGVTAIHPIEPKAMQITEVKERVGDRLCLIGNVDVDLLARGTPDEIREKVRENIETVGFNGGYIVGSGNSIPEYVDFNNYLAMLRAAREFGGG